NRRLPDHEKQLSPTPNPPPPDHRRTNLESNRALISNTNTVNDCLDKRGRIPPKRFSAEDFRSPDVRRKRTIRDLEEGTEQYEEQTQLKRK
ncbi:Hypothetical predicted protein, partial [Pelobates cultripes]